MCSLKEVQLSFTNQKHIRLVFKFKPSLQGLYECWLLLSLFCWPCDDPPSGIWDKLQCLGNGKQMFVCFTFKYPVLHFIVILWNSVPTWQLWNPCVDLETSHEPPSAHWGKKVDGIWILGVISLQHLAASPMNIYPCGSPMCAPSNRESCVASANMNNAASKSWPHVQRSYIKVTCKLMRGCGVQFCFQRCCFFFFDFHTKSYSTETSFKILLSLAVCHYFHLQNFSNMHHHCKFSLVIL